jgi:hypothetical protein
LDARRREQERLDHESQSQPLSPVSPIVPSTPPAKTADEPFTQTPKVAYPVPLEPENAPPSPSVGTGRKGPSKQTIVFLAIAAVLMVGGLIYLAIRSSQSPPPRPAPFAAATPSPPVIATPTVEEKVPPTARWTFTLARRRPPVRSTPTG